MSVNPLLLLKSIEKSYVIGESDFHVLKGVDLRVDSGDFIVIHGQDGAGKSALLNILAGIENSTSGAVEIDGQAVKPEEREHTFLGSDVSFLSPVFSLNSRLSIREAMHRPNLVQAISPQRALEMVGIQADDNRRIGQLDQETRRKIGTARALMARPRLILADLTPPPWGVAPTLESLVVANQKLGSAIIVTSTSQVEMPRARSYSLTDGKMIPTHVVPC